MAFRKNIFVERTEMAAKVLNIFYCMLFWNKNISKQLFFETTVTGVKVIEL